MKSFLTSRVPQLDSLDELGFFNVDEVIATPDRRVMILGELVFIDEPGG